MQLEKLTLTDVGIFGGKQVFDLAPRVRNGSKRPIILFGGLNGAGKTTFLTAIRLALYGRHSIESGTTQKQYEYFLRELIHRPTNSLVHSTSASISLEFTHARLGERVLYRVLRTWDAQSQGVDERIRVFRNREEQEVLSGEQAQSFLNQLIPSGISQFFFFDGEKIAALARDDSDALLADSIRRLLGLDLADRLSSDLAVFLRQRSAKRFDCRTQDEIANLETQIASFEADSKLGILKLESELIPALDSAKSEYERRRAALMERGGAWAVDRDELEKRLEALRTERREIEEKLREQLSGVAIFTLAPKLSAVVVDRLEFTQVAAEQRTLAKAITLQASVLKARLASLEKLKGTQRIIGTCIDTWVAELTTFQRDNCSEIEYGFSDSEARSAIVSLSIAAPLAQRELASTYEIAHRLALDEDSIQERLANAPSEDSLKEAFEALTRAAEVVAGHEMARKHMIEEVRRKTWASIEVIRKLKKLGSLANDVGREQGGEHVAESLQELIAEFKVESAKEKCKTLRHHFVAAFTRLARKEDIVHDARIDDRDFAVTLLSRTGQEIPKKRLSAGEKQIYAIAMLEALAKTSGRNLPIIIDTPLGRLDSEHRQKLMESYFPVASHQVIVLSTDTEVDFPFYQGLQQHLSHGYHLSFDESEGMTKVDEGYFWKNLVEEAQAHAA